MNHNDTRIKDERRLLSKTMYLSLYCKGSKRVTQGFTVRGSGRPNRNCNILTPTLMAVSVVSFSFSRVAQPAAQRPTRLTFSTTSYQQLLWTSTQSEAPRAPTAWCGFLYHILSATSLDPNSIRGSKGPFGLVWLSLLHLNSNSNCLTSVLTELYNSSTPTQSPTQSLEWHV